MLSLAAKGTLACQTKVGLMGLQTAAETAINQCLDLKDGESVIVVTDEKTQVIGKALYQAATDVTSEATIIEYESRNQHGTEPPAPVAAAMQNADAFLAPTSKSLSHTRAREHACEAGGRGATLPGITEEVFKSGLDADYESIQETSNQVYEKVAGANKIRITTEAGTDITIYPGDREWHTDTGIIHSPGEFSNLPAGEVFVSPESADGTYVVDGTMMPHGRLEGQQLQFEVEDGQITSISDEAIQEQVESAAEEVGQDAYNFAELGIGTNTAVTDLVGSVLLDEKAAGTVHLAIGDDAAIGGDTEAPLHLDGIITDPTVYVDGTKMDLPVPDN
ncbi:aminopeptidase [Salinarchaeum sp. IM2453]|nr:aminopeptidase [Salinarchaeum sp. IM2453]